jgi:hypothetical protein
MLSFAVGNRSYGGFEFCGLAGNGDRVSIAVGNRSYGGFEFCGLAGNGDRVSNRDQQRGKKMPGKNRAFSGSIFLSVRN